MEYIHPLPQVHYVIISVREKQNYPLVEHYEWHDLPFDLRIKYDWYFKYRAALLQVKYPKHYVEFRFGHVDATGPDIAKALQNRIRAKRSKITEYKNKLRLYEQQQAEQQKGQLFTIPIDEMYPKAIAKIKRLECELQLLVAEQNSYSAKA